MYPLGLRIGRNQSQTEKGQANHNELTPLYIASYKGHFDVVKCLIVDGKVDVDKTNNDGQTPLCIASYKGYLDAVKCLIVDGKADVDKADNNDNIGQTPLFIASAKGRLGFSTHKIGTSHIPEERRYSSQGILIYDINNIKF
eukprot:Awhi_evm1s4386